MANKIPKLNDQNEVIGETTIAEAKANGWMRRIARIFIFDTTGRMLLQRRGDVASFPFHWDQAAGGHIDLGESDQEAAFRETKEELGIDVVLKEICTGHRSDNPYDKVFSSVYVAVIDPLTSINFDPGEVAEVKWFTVEEFEAEAKAKPKNFTPGFLKIWFEYRDTLIP